MDFSLKVAALLRTESLPRELIAVIRQGSNTDFLAAVSSAALDAKLTDQIFIHLEPLFAEICSRWISSGAAVLKITAAFGRILPFAPYLAECAETLFLSQSEGPPYNFFPGCPDFQKMKEPEIVESLLAIFRLLRFDNGTFGKFVQASTLQLLLTQSSPPIRYLAVRVLCLYLHAADAALQNMISKYLGDDEVLGVLEGKNIDYRFFSLWEEQRYEDLSARLAEIQNSTSSGQEFGDICRMIAQDDLSPSVVDISGILLPRSGNSSAASPAPSMVPTPTTVTNLRSMAEGILTLKPLLLTGLAGSGKTLLTTQLATVLNKLDSMVTLHLNEQSDAKLLIGMYTTGETPGTFHWKPGVLTTAVREGRWVLIEDIDRAPNEIVSTLLPLIEHGELLIPSRGETVRAARGFKIIATMRTSQDFRGRETPISQRMIGWRFWHKVHVEMPSNAELGEVIRTLNPQVEAYICHILSIYSRIRTMQQHPSMLAAVKVSSVRPLTPRDLLKWSDRTSALFTRLPTSASITDRTLDDMFLEAVDCFASSIPSGPAQDAVIACIAEELTVEPERAKHLLSRKITYSKAEGGILRVGRAVLHREAKSRSRTRTTRKPFATNGHTLRLLERVAVAVDRREPLLLVGETGTGKTTSIQQLADQLGRKLVVFNLSQQSESSDLLGGFKPVNMRSLITPMMDEFEELFGSTFSRKKNQRFIEMLKKYEAKGEWKRVSSLWSKALVMVDETAKAQQSQASLNTERDGQPKKKRKIDSLPSSFSRPRWDAFASSLESLEARLASSSSDAFAFSFVEGNIVRAIRNGDWVLLDEINLASSDTLESLADLLGGGSGGVPSILLTETGSPERIKAHPDFRVFAAMNPATDVGKKDLPMGIRSRFTEIYVDSPDRDRPSLESIIETYLSGHSPDVRVVADTAQLYLDIQKLAEENRLVDGANQKPHFSLRTLTRTMTFATEIAPLCSLRRALFEGFHMSFLTFLDKTSEDLVAPLIQARLFQGHSNERAEMKKNLKRPKDGHPHVQIGQYWLRQGNCPVAEQPQYIVTPFIQRNLNNLIRAASTRRFPVLIQGPTSSGKTSMIEYLARRSGNNFVRINNHEHTDLQEYLGAYMSGPDGRLEFQEGVLVRALREGHWIVLDELNLAPTDVLEALNRLLDDNRELLIPETQEVVRPHENFMLFATQNPAGLYGGRKVLSRAFRNRFLELHFDDIPVGELNEILQRRTQIPPSWSDRIVQVYKELSVLRQETRLFEQKSFATLRDLFRWALRNADDSQELAVNGYMLLAERVRKPEERQMIKGIIEKIIPRVKINEESLYAFDNSPEIQLYDAHAGPESGVVWTQAMRRLFVLVTRALRHNEPVLLVGETGCGKTTVCQMLAAAFRKQLHIVNAHQNTETGDIIGAQRPVRNRAAIESQLRKILCSIPFLNCEADWPTKSTQTLLQAYDSLAKEDSNNISSQVRESVHLLRTRLISLFEWADGGLVHAMRQGEYFLLDEISLADDSVLERLNSVLESQRTLLLAEKGAIDSSITAAEGFQFMATMNPGGDYGKRELSPALRNRFTEIWVPALSDVGDIQQIVHTKLTKSAAKYSAAIVSFSQWFNCRYNTSAASSISIRDTLAWVEFINRHSGTDPLFAIYHGAAMVFIDTLGANPASLLSISPSNIDAERDACIHHLGKLLGQDLSSLSLSTINITSSPSTFSIGPFSLSKHEPLISSERFSFEAPTTKRNTMKIVRALQLVKPILLEGNPGVGKTTLVIEVARAVGMPLTRINLSEQTDLMDLFGSDVPVEGAHVGTFAWRDAPFLRAMKKGEWVLLDEMNLASQSVLEGLNACLDHRGQVYIAELDQTFSRHPEFRVFAAQNPHHQGGGRKGLPASFVNRFTVVYADVFRPKDLLMICAEVFTNVAHSDIEKLIRFVAELDDAVINQRRFGALGSPWEFNLRDTLRWLKLLTVPNGLLPAGSVRDFLDTVITQRFRATSDRQAVLALYSDVFSTSLQPRNFYHNLSGETSQVGLGLLGRNPVLQFVTSPLPRLTNAHLEVAESLMLCVQQNWPVVLVGGPGSGKTLLIRQLAALAGADLVTFSMNSDIDAMDLVGGYEQTDPSRQVHSLLAQLQGWARTLLIKQIISDATCPMIVNLFQLLQLIAMEPSKITPEILGNTWNLTTEVSWLEDALPLLQQLDLALNEMGQKDKKAQFQWVDGLLVQAMEQGQWLVLDNANLCSSAVLDRLNSLLEPNGYLIINEHITENGEAKVVKPHPTFRIFLTMDPRYGELSRAMRNRAIEIYLDPPFEPNLAPIYFTESSIFRFRQLKSIMGFPKSKTEMRNILNVSLDHLSLKDKDRLPSFWRDVSNGLFNGDPYLVSLIHDLASAHSPLLAELKVAIMKYQDDRTNLLSVKTDYRGSQSIHPLNNQQLACHKQRNPCDAIWLADLYEMWLDTMMMNSTLRNAKDRSMVSKPIGLTMLGRSFQSSRIPRFSKDSTASIATFLGETKDMLLRWIVSVLNGNVVENGILPVLHDWRVFWWNLLQLVDSESFEEAVFQVYLSSGSECLKGISPDTSTSRGLIEQFTQALTKFNCSGGRTTGLSMERLWEKFRPTTPSTYQRLQALLRLEKLASRFDRLAWLCVAPLDDLKRSRAALKNAIGLAINEGVELETLSVTLATAINDMEQSIPENAVEMVPYLHDEFEGLFQFHDLAQKATCTPERRAFLSLLAGRFTTTYEESHATPAQAISRLAAYLGQTRVSGIPIALESNWHFRVLSKLNCSGDVTLRRLDFFQSELRIFGEFIASNTEPLCEYQINSLDHLLEYLFFEVLQVHQDMLVMDLSQPTGFLTFLVPNTSQLRFVDELPPTHHFRNIATEFFQPCADYIYHVHFRSGGWGDPERKKREGEASRAWINFALGALFLYVPDRPFDPALRPMVERRFFHTKRDHFEQALTALQVFEKTFTGQQTNMRTQIIESGLQGLGEEPPLAAIARPPVSEVSRLHGDLQNLLGVIRMVQAELQDNNLPVDDTLRRNISQIINRLSDGYRAYDDITGPTVGFLHCLNVGLIIGSLIDSGENTQSSGEVMYVSRCTPFLGSHRDFWKSPGISQLPSPNLSRRETNWHMLSSLALSRSMEPSRPFSVQERQFVMEIFQSLYEQWKDQLREDRENTAAKTSLYRYRGGQLEEEDANEEDYQKLFPDYETQGEVQGESAESPLQESAVKLCGLHHSMFLGKISSSERLRSLILESAQLLAHASKDNLLPRTSPSVTDSLPAIFMSIDHLSRLLQDAPSTKRAYNFYQDPNIPEARKFTLLLTKIQHRFIHLREISLEQWDDHATIREVLEICNEGMEFRHIEPIAKLLTKGEKLHGTIHQWQTVASQTFSAANLYDQLTNLLVSWRQLELTTWARLFDLEMENCVNDAKAWWFIAYENIIAAPMALASSGGAMQQHSNDLLKTLERFFSSTSLGQFEPRLRLLEQFIGDLSLRINDIPELVSLRTALANFIDYMSRYEVPVREAVLKGRQTLEKDMRDVLKLASWRDRTIEALRQSAKTSHRKLFKLVRKFRALLSQPFEAILKQGPATSSPFTFPSQPLAAIHSTTDSVALDLCIQHIPNWNERPARFKNISSTLSVMKGTCSVPESAIESSSYVHSFLTNLENSMSQLQRDTPPVLTEENKQQVQHLKSRKKKLFADTLKTLREMGFKSNIGADILAKQADLPTVLANLPYLNLKGFVDGIGDHDYYFHKTLDLMPRVRDIAREHSGDITGSEVARSISFLESMFHTAIKQRGVLSKTLTSLDGLKRTSEQLQALWAPSQYSTFQADRRLADPARSASQIIIWLVPICTIGAEIIAAQTKHGQFDVSQVVHGLQHWASIFQNLDNEFSTLPQLPEQICSSSDQELISRSKDLLDSFRSDLEKWSSDQQTLRCVLNQIHPWTNYSCDEGYDVNSLTSLPSPYSLGEYSEQALNNLDQILGSMQDVETTLKSLPTSTEDSLWLIKEDKILYASISALRITRVASELEVLASKTNRLGDKILVAGAMFACLKGIVQQYQHAVEYIVTRLASLNHAITRMTHQLAKAFVQVGTQGFCTPQEKSDENAGQNDKLESGTGLGDGEGAEDISKDIEEDEDLTELAQEPNKNEKGEEIENEKDAVDMNDEELEGEIGEASEQGSDAEGSDREDEDMEDEVGDVDDLGPSTVDEKMWDDPSQDADKDKEGEQGKGKQNNDEQVASGDREGGQQDEAESDKDEEMDAPADEPEQVGEEEMEKTDPNLEQGENLELPDDLNMDGEKSDRDGDESGLEDLEDFGEDETMEEVIGEADEGTDENIDHDAQDSKNENAESVGDEEEREEQDGENQASERMEETPEEQTDQPLTAQDESANNDKEDTHQDTAETGVSGEAGEDDGNDKQAAARAPNREEGSKGEQHMEHQAASSDGTRGRAPEADSSGHADEVEETPASQALKKIGDASERWYKQQRQILDAALKEESQTQDQSRDIDMADAEFEHLPDDETEAEAQALGTTSEDQAKGLDESMGVASNEQERILEDLPEENGVTKSQEVDEDVPMEDALPPAVENNQKTNDQSQAFIGQPNDHQIFPDFKREPLEDVESDSISEVDQELATVQIEKTSPPFPLSAPAARALWTTLETRVRPLALALTEQLRLILAPTLATKMRGDFRTGKRLNIKKIIPYIASQYKRDKIWLRRSMPSKRNYQILLALDDSLSMAEDTRSQDVIAVSEVDLAAKTKTILAFETLALVSKALAALEAGSICITSFGQDVNVAHPFDKPFTTDSGANVLSQFGFAQRSTDVARLVEDAIRLFGEARLKTSDSGRELWQLGLVISDGHCDDHARVARLVRKAQEERIMLVFVIVDKSSTVSNIPGSDGAVAVPKKQSIFDLIEVTVDEKGHISRRRYMDSFPFRWYIVVRDVGELPGVLATALRQWFGEVVESGR